MFDSPERERQLDASAMEIMSHRAHIIDAAIGNIARANMVNVPESDNLANFTAYRQQQQALAQVATSTTMQTGQERRSA